MKLSRKLLSLALAGAVIAITLAWHPTTAWAEEDGAAAGESSKSAEDGAKEEAGEKDTEPASDTDDDKDNEVVVTATRTKEDPNKTPRGISSVDWKDMEKRSASAGTTAELVRGEPGVYLQQTGRHGGAQFRVTLPRSGSAVDSTNA